jgi:2'-5' RNA ligase
LKNYGTFRRNGVVFIDVEKSAELKVFYKQLVPRVHELLPGVKLKGGGSFNPHFTIGYRDIPEEVYEQAADEYEQKTFDANFSADKFYLWKHNRKFWEVQHIYEMKALPPDRSGELFH